jgi:hypothetical protein
MRTRRCLNRGRSIPAHLWRTTWRRAAPHDRDGHEQQPSDLRLRAVGGTGIEPVASSVSGKPGLWLAVS